MRTTVQRWTMNLSMKRPEFRRLLGGSAVSQLIVTPTDPWPADASAGAALLLGQLRIGSATATLPEAFEIDLPAGAFARLHGFDWLRDLRGVGSTQARAVARQLITEWLTGGAFGDSRNSEAALVGTRLANWLSAYAFFTVDADDDFRDLFLNGISVQFDLLPAALTRPIDALPGLAICQGLLAVAINLENSDKLISQATHQLQIIVSRFLLPDGGTKMRAPIMQMQALQRLLDCRRLLQAANLHSPDSLTVAITAMAAALRLMRHGDGALALFHGGTEGTPALIDAVLAESGQVSRRRFSLPASGYERVAQGRSLLIVDTGPQPPRAMNAAGHASASSLEFSYARDRIFVNCGAADADEPKWQQALAATAAHTTAVVRDTSICDPRISKGVRKVLTVRAQRYEQEGFDCVDVTHDGYHDTFGVNVRRIVALDAAGDRLIGREIISGAANVPFTLRFHLHPAVTAAVTQGQQSALLRTPSGSGWRFRATQGRLSMEPSIYACEAGLREPTQQIVITGHSGAKDGVLDWMLERETR